MSKRRRRSISRAVIRKRNNKMSKEEHISRMLEHLMNLFKRTKIITPKRITFLDKEYIIE